MGMTRRAFGLGIGSSAFVGLSLAACASTPLSMARTRAAGYGPLVPDANGLLDLPQGFSYRIISRMGDRMTDGFFVPDRADGMGAFRLDSRRMALVRNHELAPRHVEAGPFRAAPARDVAGYDHRTDGAILPGGTTTIIYDYHSGRVESQHLSLVGTIRNCAGGTTPWGSWLSCEEDVTRAGDGVQRDHGWVFEVPVGNRGVSPPVPLRSMGRFNHEAAAVDPRTGIVYLTEDRYDGLFYRFLPEVRGQLGRGGRLQALAFADPGRPADTRNIPETGTVLALRSWQPVRWIDLEQIDSPADDLRLRGHASGAAFLARAEGIFFADGDVFICCTFGGPQRLGHIIQYRPSRFEGEAREANEPGSLQILLESNDAEMFNEGDNIAVAPNGDLIVCEDQYSETPRNHLRGVVRDGSVYTFALLHDTTEFAGACISPDRRTLFVNLYSPTRTVAITGPW